MHCGKLPPNDTLPPAIVQNQQWFRDTVALLSRRHPRQEDPLDRRERERKRGRESRLRTQPYQLTQPNPKSAGIINERSVRWRTQAIFSPRAPLCPTKACAVCLPCLPAPVPARATRLEQELHPNRLPISHYCMLRLACEIIVQGWFSRSPHASEPG
jgi:hypothetical protein